jgi:hypothetical protein
VRRGLEIATLANDGICPILVTLRRSELKMPALPPNEQNSLWSHFESDRLPLSSFGVIFQP